MSVTVYCTINSMIDCVIDSMIDCIIDSMKDMERHGESMGT